MSETLCAVTLHAGSQSARLLMVAGVWDFGIWISCFLHFVRNAG